VLDELRDRLDEPSARGLAGAVSRAVRDGVLRPGDRLPPIRAVADGLELSPTTVSAAWSLLARSATIRTDGRRGTTIADRRRPGSPRYRRALDHAVPLRLELSTGVPDPELLPDLAAALRHTGAPAAPASYLDDPVVAELGALLRADWPYPVDDLAVVDGAMDGLDLVTRALLDVGERVAVESPGFPPLLDLLEASGAELVGVPVDAEGLSAEALRAAGRVRAIYVQPRAQNPTGVSLTAARAGELAALAREWNAVVVEDDSAGAVAASEPVSVGRHVPERTVHVRSFAKSHGPDLRLAALSAPPELAARVQGLRQLGQGWTSRLLQRVLHTLLTDPDAVDTVAHAREAYRERRARLVAALAEQAIEVGGSDGLNIWVPVADETAAVARLAGRGIGVAPGAPFAARTGQPPHVRVTAGLVRAGYAELAAEIADAARGAVRIPV
jgi:DNA-binding transcriptional MocR family regulator